MECQGKWRANIKHGTAEEIYSNGDKFIGKYVEGLRTGQGKYIWKDGRYFVGNYKDNKKSGMFKYKQFYIFTLLCFFRFRSIVLFWATKIKLKFIVDPRWSSGLSRQYLDRG